MSSTTAFYQAMAEKAAAQVPTIPQGPEATTLCPFEAAGLQLLYYFAPWFRSPKPMLMLPLQLRGDARRPAAGTEKK